MATTTKAAKKVKPWQEYIDDVLKGRRVCGELEKLCVERCVKLMKKKEYFFDEAAALRILEIIGHFKHTKGEFAGKPFELFPWQKFFFSYIFGLKHKKTGFRVVRKVLLCMAKKGGKSEVGGVLGNLMTFFDGEQGAECYSAANKYDQAMFCWNAGKKIMKQLARESEAINNTLKVYDSITNRSLVDLETDSYFSPLAADAKTMDGRNSHCSIIDEYHEAKDSSIPDNLESGSVARAQPLLCIITTRGFNKAGVLGQLEDNYVSILRGQMENDNVFPLIFAMDEGDDWNDESKWEKANPGLGRAPTLEGLRNEYKKALTEGARTEISFRTKNLNQWTNTAKTWVSDKVWLKNSGLILPEQIEYKPCYVGIDLAVSRDISGYGLLFPPDDPGGKFLFKANYYCPEEGAMERSRQDRVPYFDWEREGRLKLTPGDMTDYSFIEADLLADSTKYNILEAAYDPFQSHYLAVRLANYIEMSPFKLIYSYCNEPVGFTEKILHEHRLIYDDCPILRWMAGNVEMITNSTGLRRPTKDNKKKKIDGIVMLIMAMGKYLNAQAEQPNYEMTWM